MLRLFRNKKQTGADHPQLDKAASWFAKKIIGFQTRVAGWLSKQEQKLTIPQKKMALIVFCISTAILSASYLFRALNEYHDPSPAWFSQPSIAIPETHPLPDSIDEQLLKEYQKFKRQSQTPVTTDSVHY